MKFFNHKDLGIHLLQQCPQVVKQPVYMNIQNNAPSILFLYQTCDVYLEQVVLELCWNIITQLEYKIFHMVLTMLLKKLE